MVSNHVKKSMCTSMLTLPYLVEVRGSREELSLDKVHKLLKTGRREGWNEKRVKGLALGLMRSRSGKKGRSKNVPTEEPDKIEKNVFRRAPTFPNEREGNIRSEIGRP